MCFALALWNGRDPFLKERIFGLSGTEGNHGEDAKEYWWYVDATPTASWLQWRYHYPQAEFPYARLREENARRDRTQREFDLEHTGAFDANRYWQVEVDYAKAAPNDVCVRIRIRNAGPDAAELHVLPTLWFRNRWAWDLNAVRPSIHAVDGRAGAVAEEERIGRWLLEAGDGGRGAPQLLFCDNDTNFARVFAGPAQAPYPKDGINDHVVTGAATVNPERRGTKMACWYRETVAPNETIELRLRLARSDADTALDLAAGFDRTFADRAREADEYHASMRMARHHRRRGRGDAAGVRRHGVEPAVLSLRRGAAGSTAIRPNRRRRPRARPAATRIGGTSTTTTSSRCRTSGSIRGTPHGIWRSTASCSRTPIPRPQSTSCC